MSDKIGIIYSPFCGAGWSTWGESAQALDQELATAISTGCSSEHIEEIAKKNWPDAYRGGLDDCVVQWVEKGTEFYIEDYDGNESIHFNTEDFWQVAK